MHISEPLNPISDEATAIPSKPATTEREAWARKAQRAQAAPSLRVPHSLVRVPRRLGAQK